ncbi:hypothetical protein QE428_001565 [Microbacterium sp. SORGH_AS 505]|uniref:hypothetical protein n=1 Tax=Microbacterium sp. SORGH_AS_0505 TaxID=3041770 RepID=UPI002789ADBE|nr:hypothetical protein [Microbacterium sp. SORGH_AS_0505]MDQ1126532.1 hypothetical protein [Microbacterium sp. SORGH_AS_0505]
MAAVVARAGRGRMRRGVIVMGTVMLAALMGCTAAEVRPSESQPMRVGLEDTSGSPEPNWVTGVSWWTKSEPRTVFGVDVCMVDGAEAKIIAVEPVEKVGSVIDLTPLVLSAPSPAGGVISATGYPPPMSDDVTFVAAKGAQFTYACGSRGGVQQIVIGLEATGPEGGGWKGISVRYSVGGAPHELVVPLNALMCGTETEPCGRP